MLLYGNYIIDIPHTHKYTNSYSFSKYHLVLKETNSNIFPNCKLEARRLHFSKYIIAF